MEILIKLNIEKLPEGVYLGTSEQVPGLVAQGRTIEETIEIAHDIAKKILEIESEGIDFKPIDNRVEIPMVVNL